MRKAIFVAIDFHYFRLYGKLSILLFSNDFIIFGGGCKIDEFSLAIDVLGAAYSFVLQMLTELVQKLRVPKRNFHKMYVMIRCSDLGQNKFATIDNRERTPWY